MKEIYGVFGAGGYGREVMPLARKQLQKIGKSIESLFFVVDNVEKRNINGTQVISLTEFLKIDAEQKYLTFAIADGKARASLINRVQSKEILDWTVIAENCVVLDGVTIGLGSILSPFVTITSNVTIGSSFHANLYSYIAHDCVIGDYVTFAPGVKCNGNVVIESHAYVGAGAIIRPGRTGKPLRIGEGAVIGMGAVVTKDVPAGVTVFGNPAKIIKAAA
ncbi:acetyltransferase [Limnohabitans sp. Rim8]|uniref:acetyltransferase n=1 Tax=Limnohabitans sp. Rim8 TaxID=1100718 RepID=UPI000D3AB92F|nr:acetyltransferase [Limnohabitans sp. Rim8]PUE54816.1 acetyltransferase [Limnohabitans sp. Rim8]